MKRLLTCIFFKGKDWKIKNLKYHEADHFNLESQTSFNCDFIGII